MSTDKNVQQLIASMTIAEKVGQLFILAFAGPDKEYALSLVKDKHIGGFYITDDNAGDLQQAKLLAQSLQAQAALRVCDAPLILGVDQEGAWGILAKQTDLGPGNLALGKVDDLTLTANVYQVFAQQMQALGYNTLLSPCADINANPKNPIIGQRAFGEQTERVASHVAAAIKGIKRTQNLACAKHFPGHGDTHTDSHRDLPVVDKDLLVLLTQDLAPFQAAVDSGVDLIMTSHIKYPQLDKDNPATLSRTILTDLLIKEMKFDGLIITDSMNMWAMRKYYQPEQAAIRALEAGAHLIMLSEEHYENESTDYKAIQTQTIDGVIQAVESSQLDEAIIDKALAKVLLHRYKKLADTEFKTLSAISDKQASEFSRQACLRAVSRLRDNNSLLPLTDKPFYISFMANPKGYENIVNSRGIGPNDARSAKDGILNQLNLLGKNYQHIEYHEFEAWLAKQQTLDTPLVLVTEDYPLAGESFDTPEQVNRVQNALTKLADNILVLAMRSDYELAFYPQLSTYVCAYSSRYLAAQQAVYSLFEK
ncbi:glycoside hydrolase family 3 protein [Catenovulum sp. SM1970]|uniref:glycoside hydrolase family 3 protein n=1 Tax=Marinifaba aquimaris TaxID=2741323 RepID=UPI001572D200|nr:glycoside hydrolase family 3 N-terminal domain-containing protein [Marinifaba aquimaris]NTS78190.1 glycoside hydrolase family 3 protein [Marinifaba aquimaris]